MEIYGRSFQFLIFAWVNRLPTIWKIRASKLLFCVPYQYLSSFLCWTSPSISQQCTLREYCRKIHFRISLNKHNNNGIEVFLVNKFYWKMWVIQESNHLNRIPFWELFETKRWRNGIMKLCHLPKSRTCQLFEKREYCAVILFLSNIIKVYVEHELAILYDF